MSYRRLQTQEEKEAAIKEAKEWFDKNSTGFVTIGGNSTVHACHFSVGSVYTNCGSDGGNTSFKKRVSFVQGPATCKRCLKAAK